MVARREHRACAWRSSGGFAVVGQLSLARASIRTVARDSGHRRSVVSTESRSPREPSVGLLCRVLLSGRSDVGAASSWGSHKSAPAGVFYSVAALVAAPPWSLLCEVLGRSAEDGRTARGGDALVEQISGRRIDHQLAAQAVAEHFADLILRRRRGQHTRSRCER